MRQFEYFFASHNYHYHDCNLQSSLLFITYTGQWPVKCEQLEETVCDNKTWKKISQSEQKKFVQKSGQSFFSTSLETGEKVICWTILIVEQLVRHKKFLTIIIIVVTKIVAYLLMVNLNLTIENNYL